MLRSSAVAARVAARATTRDAPAVSSSSNIRRLLPLRTSSTTHSRRPLLTRSIESQWRSYATRGRPKVGGAATGLRGRPKTASKTTKRKATTKAAKSKKVAAKLKKKVPTEKQKQAAAKKKEREELKELKETALMHTEPKKKPDSAYRVFVTENMNKGVKASEHMKEVASKFKTLSAAELEVRSKPFYSFSTIAFTDGPQQYNHTANQNKAANESAYLNWVEQHTPEQIRLANTARASLRRKMTNGKKVKRSGHGFSAIKDDRQVKRPTNAFFKFNNERQSSGDLKNIQIIDAAKLVKREWDAMSAGQRKVRSYIPMSIQ